MQTRNTDVEQFHKKHGFPCRMDLSNRSFSKRDSLALMDAAELLERLAEVLKDPGLKSQKVGDERMYRAHLIVEEAAETLRALGSQDEVALADATGDLRYVNLGTDLTFNIPSDHVDAAIHASNMSKMKRTPENARMRDKGPNYKPPDIRGAIKRGREAAAWNESINSDRCRELSVGAD